MVFLSPFSPLSVGTLSMTDCERPHKARHFGDALMLFIPSYFFCIQHFDLGVLIVILPSNISNTSMCSVFTRYSTFASCAGRHSVLAHWCIATAFLIDIMNVFFPELTVQGMFFISL